MLGDEGAHVVVELDLGWAGLSNRGHYKIIRVIRLGMGSCPIVAVLQ